MEGEPYALRTPKEKNQRRKDKKVRMNKPELGTHWGSQDESLQEDRMHGCGCELGSIPILDNKWAKTVIKPLTDVVLNSTGRLATLSLHRLSGYVSLVASYDAE